MLPDEIVGDRFDLLDFYWQERRYFYGTLWLGFSIGQLTGVADAWPTASGADRLLITAWMTAPLILIALLWWRAGTRLHAVCLTLLFLLGALGFLPWSIEGASAVVP